jgi:hypothetical protein
MKHNISSAAKVLIFNPEQMSKIPSVMPHFSSLFSLSYLYLLSSHLLLCLLHISL